MNKKIKIGLFALIILGTITLCLTYKSDDKIIKTKKRKQNNLAIMIKEDGATDYTKSNSKDIPKGDYVLNRDKSYCKNNGKIGNYDSTLGKVSFSFIGSDSCYLYFDYKEDPSLYGTIKKRAKTDTTYLALYTGEGSDTYANPVYYYKGNVQNNNVLFGGFCWKIVRTTETGGVKIVYNGVQKDGSCNNTGTDSQIGTSTFNNDSNSPAYVGYMHNTVYPYSSKVIINSTSFSGTKAYGVSASYNMTHFTYTLTNAKTIDVSSSNISTLVGKYTCNQSATTATCSNLWYIVGYSGTTIYYYSLSGGDLDGTDNGSNYVFGKSFTYNGSYSLSDTTTIHSDNWATKKTTVNNYHYTCLSSGTTCSSIYYVSYINNGTAYYTTLTGGKSVNDALNEMLYADDVNRNDSEIKKYIDIWYENNLKDKYDDKLEDTVFCNDRRILDLNGWNPNGGDTTSSLLFKNGSTNNKSLVCTNETDSFSMSNPKANLNYPIGLLSMPELRLAGFGSSHYFNNEQRVWLASPIGFSDFTAVGMTNSVDFVGSNVFRSGGVRPSVSLKPKTYFSSGDGSFTKPFVIGDAVEEPSGKSFDRVFAANDTDIFNENGLRYEGADPNNYICLDNKTSGACSSSSLLFRIIGLFDEDTSSDGTNSSGTKKLLKVIDTNNYGGTSGKYWSGSSSNKSNNWSKSTLNTELNGIYLSTLLATSGVNSKLSSAIVNAKWHLGGANNTSSSNYYSQKITTENWYKAERSPYATSGTLQNLYSGNPEYVFAKVGLMYPSDYGYATVGGSTTSKANCRAKELYNWDSSSYSDCKNNDWVYKSQSISWGSNKDEWYISPLASYSAYASCFNSTGYVGAPYSVYNFQFAVRPTFYLDSSILKIVGGTGTSDNAYRIG